MDRQMEFFTSVKFKQKYNKQASGRDLPQKQEKRRREKENDVTKLQKHLKSKDSCFAVYIHCI